VIGAAASGWAVYRHDRVRHGPQTGPTSAHDEAHYSHDRSRAPTQSTARQRRRSITPA
jgi:hypothetical protein